MTSLPELPPELQRQIRERAHRKTSLADAEVLSGKALGPETRRTSVGDVRGNRRRSTVEKAARSSFFHAAEPEVESRSSLCSGLRADDDPTTRKPVGSTGEPSFHSRPGTGCSYSPFGDAGPDEMYWISRYRNHCHPPRPPRRPLSTGGNQYPICTSSTVPSSFPSSAPDAFKVVPCNLLHRSLNIKRSTSPVGLLRKQSASSSRKQVVISASEARHRSFDAELAPRSLRGGCGTKSGHPLRRICSEIPPPGSANYQGINRGPTITTDPNFDPHAAHSVDALSRLCLSITSMVRGGRTATPTRPGSMRTLKSSSSHSKYQKKVKKLSSDRQSSVPPNRDERDTARNINVSVTDGTSGTFKDGTVLAAPGEDGSDISMIGTVPANDGTDVTPNETVQIGGEAEAIVYGTKIP